MVLEFPWELMKKTQLMLVFELLLLTMSVMELA
jgi:hypothetical protein